MRKQKSIESLEKKNLGNFVKAYGSKIVGGNRTMTIKEVVITVPKKLQDDETTVDGNDDGDTEPGPWY